MVYRFEQPMPPRGSTAWGATQIYRLLDVEERAADREQRFANGERSTRGPEAMTSVGLPTRAGGGRLLAFAPPSNSNVLPVLDPTTAGSDFDLLVGRSPGRASAIVAAYIQIAITLTLLLTRTASTPEERKALQRKTEAAEFAYRRLTHMMAAQFSRDELARIQADSGVDFELIEGALHASTADPAPIEEHQPAQDWAADPAWLPLLGRDILEDDDYCQRRWEAELFRCGRWKQDWARRGCRDRAGHRHNLCRGNGGTPHPLEPDEWSEKDMERWYNPYR